MCNPPDPEYAEDVTELREAQRLIADLRRTLAQPAALTAYADGEFTIFLDDLHTDLLITLFEQQRLIARQDRSCELHDALSEFVSHWLDLQSAALRMEPKATRGKSQRITMSA